MLIESCESCDIKLSSAVFEEMCSDKKSIELNIVCDLRNGSKRKCGKAHISASSISLFLYGQAKKM